MKVKALQNIADYNLRSTILYVDLQYLCIYVDSKTLKKVGREKEETRKL